MNFQLKFLLLPVVVLFCFAANAQKHFLYIQSENQQPFAVVMNGKVYSSSDYGYVIIPKLADGKYDFVVSFPLNKFPDQNFSCSINKKDEGFKLKNKADGWALENYQSQKTVSNNNADVAKKNAFGDMLSDVVSDSSLNKKPAVPATTMAAANSAVVDSLYQPQKIAQSFADTGTNMMFVDKTSNNADTVNVFIPIENVASAATVPPSNANIGATQQSNTTQVNVNDTANLTTTSSKNSDTAAHDVSNPFYKPGQQNDNTTNAVTTQTATPVINSAAGVKQDCSNMIDDDDFNKLKRKMFTHSDDQSMVQYAVKSLGKKCISTSQVKTLGQLFLSDDGRYNLFDAMYMHTYDYSNYASLSSQIIDPYYKKRFIALLR